MAEVAWGSSAVGAILLRIILPWAVLHYGFVYDGAPSLLVWLCKAVFGLVVGGIIGAVVVPVIVLTGYWIIWRIAGRP